MKGFIEVTDRDSKEKVLINVAHIVYVMGREIIVSTIDIHAGYRSSYGENRCFNVVEQYDEICDKIYASSIKENN